ncbi:MAG: hypothetical protein LBQ58_07965 [Synergistaceae bacterium]|jgi:membrane protein implicated in regulation of membrane protease activity|nr:hypothetical protein [Synergistaceae bacterium]
MTISEWEWAHAVIGGVASLIFLMQTFGAVGGGDSDAGDDASDLFHDTIDTDDSLFHYLSVRNFVALFIGYGWVTFAALLSGSSRLTSSALGLAAGVVLVFLSLYMIKTFLRFQEDGTLDFKTLVGQHASVYITIGASSAGKVMVDTKRGRAELSARTNDPETLHPGQLVTILEVEGGILWVTGKSVEPVEAALNKVPQ